MQIEKEHYKVLSNGIIQLIYSQELMVFLSSLSS